MSNIGMMDAAFFVGRKELVDWVNDTLEINISKIEQTASGAMACQIFDIMHPGRSNGRATRPTLIGACRPGGDE